MRSEVCAASGARGGAGPRRRRRAAQARRTLADVKAELTVLSGQIEQLRDELVRSGAAGGLPTEAGDGADPARPARGGAAAADRPGRRADQRRHPHRRRRQQPGRRHRVPPDRARRRRHQRQAGAGAARRRRHPAAAAAGGAGGGAARAAARWRSASRRTSTPRWRRPTPATTPRRRSSSRRFLQDYPGGPLSTEAQYRRGEALAAHRGLARRGAQLPRRLQRRAAGPAGAARALPAGGEPRQARAGRTRPA